MELVSVQFEFEYKARDGQLVSIKPNESYILVSKTNEHWWHVRKDQYTRPFYVPAQYMKELTSHSADSPSVNKLDCVESVTITKPVDTADVTPRKTVTQDASRETYRFSTFGFCDNIPDIKPCETLKGLAETTSSFAPTPDKVKTHDSTGGFSFTSAPLKTGDVQLYSKPHLVPKVRNKQVEPKSSVQGDKAEQPQTPVVDDDNMDFPSPPHSPIYDIIPELIVTAFDTFPEPPDPVTANDISAPRRPSLNQPAEGTPSTEALSLQQVRCHTVLLPVSLFHSSISQQGAQFYHVTCCM